MKNRTLLLAILMVFLAFPVIYLILKSSGVKSVPKDQPIIQAQPQSADIAALEAAVKQNPNFNNLINLSMAYINAHMPGKSIDYLQKAIEIDPKNKVAYNNLGVAYIMLQQYQDGIDACRKALQLDNNFQLAKNNLKWGLDEKNKVLAAIKEQETLPEQNRNSVFYINYGLSYFKIGEYDKSIAIWNRILLKDPKNGNAYNNIGTALMMKHQYDAAIGMFSKAISIDANDQLAKNNLAWALGEKNKSGIK